MKTKMKIYSRSEEDHKLPYLLKMKIAFLKLFEIEDLKLPHKNVTKMKTELFAGSPSE